MDQDTDASLKAQNRRGFLRAVGERAVWVAPAVATLLIASETPANAQGGYLKKDYDPKYLWKKLFRRRKAYY